MLIATKARAIHFQPPASDLRTHLLNRIEFIFPA
jgi:hypothetical protein